VVVADDDELVEMRWGKEQAAEEFWGEECCLLYAQASNCPSRATSDIAKLRNQNSASPYRFFRNRPPATELVVSGATDNDRLHLRATDLHERARKCRTGEIGQRSRGAATAALRHVSSA
jgi:hypothetical protein